MLFYLNCYKKDFQKAEVVLKKLRDANPQRNYSEFEAWLYAEKGEKEKALSKSKSFGIYACLKMKNETLNELEKEKRMNYLDLKNFHFDFLRVDSRFEKILAQTKVQYEERLKKYGNIDLPNN